MKIPRERVEAGCLDFDQVFEKAFVETIRADPERSAQWESLSERVWVYEGIVPINVHIIEGLVLAGSARHETRVKGCS